MKGQKGRNVGKHDTTVEEQTWAQPSLLSFFFCSFRFHTESLGLNTEVLQGREKSQINIKRNITSYLHTPPSSNALPSICAISHSPTHRRCTGSPSAPLILQLANQESGQWAPERKVWLKKSHFLQDLTLATGWGENVIKDGHMIYLNVGRKCWCHHEETSYLLKISAVPPTTAGFVFPHLKIHRPPRKGTNDAHSEGESIAGDSGEGHSPLIASLCPLFVVTIHLARPVHAICRHRRLQDPNESSLILVRLGSWGGASRREQGWDEPLGTALPLLMIVPLEGCLLFFLGWGRWGGQRGTLQNTVPRDQGLARVPTGSIFRS